MIEQLTTWNGKNILKIKSEPLREVELSSGDGDDSTQDSPEKLRKEIEPWLTALFQSEHLSLLMGTGITSAVHFMAKNELPQGMRMMDFAEFKKQVETSVSESAKNAGRGEPNIEDQIRVANDLIRGMEIYLSSRTENDELDGLEGQLGKFKTELLDGLSDFAKDVLTTEKNIAISSYLENTMDYLTSFLVSFCSRSATRERLNLFTTNYDRLIEFGAEIAGVRLIDRFVGNLNPVFRASRLEVDMHYNPPGIRGEPRYLEGVVHYTKLHGSLDWINQDNTIRRFALPFGTDNLINQYFPKTLSDDTNLSQLMIYPNASKDRETAEYP